MWGMWGNGRCGGGCVVWGLCSSGSSLQRSRGGAERWWQRQGHEPGPGAQLLPLARSGGLLNKMRWEEWSRPRALSGLCLEPNLNTLGINRHFRQQGKFKYVSGIRGQQGVTDSVTVVPCEEVSSSSTGARRSSEDHHTRKCYSTKHGGEGKGRRPCTGSASGNADGWGVAGLCLLPVLLLHILQTF